MMQEPKITTLDNGLTVVTQHIAGSPQAYARLAVDVGARDEKPKQAGISHFLEHMLMADTERMTVEENAGHLLLMRGTSNASTGSEQTDFYYHLGNEHAGEAVRMLADNILRSTITAERLENERGSIQQEFLGDAHDEDGNAWNKLHQVAFPNTGLDKPIDGSMEQIANRTREELIAFKDKHYTGDKMVLTVVGDVSHEDIVAQAKEHFADLKPAPATQKPASYHSAYRGGMRTSYDKYAEQTELLLAFESSGSESHRDNLIDSVIANMLAGSFASRLFKSLRNDSGLVYSVDADTMPYKGTGLLTINTSTNCEDTEKTLNLLCKELRDFPASITEEELAYSKAGLVGNLERSMGDLESLGTAIGDAVQSGDPTPSLKGTMEQIQSVTLEEVQARAEKVLSSAPSIIASGHKKHQIPSYEDITERLGKRRELDASGLAKENIPSTDRSIGKAQLAARPQAAKSQSR